MRGQAQVKRESQSFEEGGSVKERKSLRSHWMGGRGRLSSPSEEIETIDISDKSLDLTGERSITLKFRYSLHCYSMICSYIGSIPGSNYYCTYWSGVVTLPWPWKMSLAGKGQSYCWQVLRVSRISGLKQRPELNYGLKPRWVCIPMAQWLLALSLARMGLPLCPTLVARVWCTMQSSMLYSCPRRLTREHSPSSRLSLLKKSLLGYPTTFSYLPSCSPSSTPTLTYCLHCNSSPSSSTNSASSSLKGQCIISFSGILQRICSFLVQRYIRACLKGPSMLGRKTISSARVLCFQEKRLWVQVRTIFELTAKAVPQLMERISPLRFLQFMRTTPIASFRPERACWSSGESCRRGMRAVCGEWHGIQLEIEQLQPFLPMAYKILFADGVVKSFDQMRFILISPLFFIIAHYNRKAKGKQQRGRNGGFGGGRKGKSKEQGVVGLGYDLRL